MGSCMRIFIVLLFSVCSVLWASESSSVSMFSTASTAKSLLSSTGSLMDGQRSSISLTPVSAEIPVDSNYILGPGDFLDIMLEDKYLSVQIYPDGSIAIEECGSVNVAGKTISEARKLIVDLVAKRYKREYCFVQLSVLKIFRVNVLGAVSLVGQHEVQAQTRLTYFLRQIGGTLNTANTEDILVLRGKDTIHVNYSEMISKGDFENDVMLEQGDRIYVPFVGMGENVALIYPGFRTSVAYSAERTLQDYFELSGGPRMHNYGYKSICIREPGLPARWVSLAEMKTTKVSPNSEIEFSVREMLVYVGGAVSAIGRQVYNPNWHALDYIAAAGINTMTGSWSQVKVWRGSKPKAYSVSVAEDPILPGDYIEVPRGHYETFKDFTLFVASLLTVVSSAFIIYVNYK